MQFYTTPDGSDTLTKALELQASQDVNIPNGKLNVQGKVRSESRGVVLGRPLEPEQTNSNNEPRYWGLLKLKDGEHRFASGHISGERTSFSVGISMWFRASSGWDGDYSGKPSDAAMAVEIRSRKANTFTELVQFTVNGNNWIGIERDPGGCCNNFNIQFTGQAMINSKPTNNFPQIFGPDEVSNVASFSGHKADFTKFGGKINRHQKVDMNKNQIDAIVVDKRSSNPSSPAVGQMWYRTDLD
ncbi:MAG: hypothetical protein ABEJ03_01285 [Candidatus Nanohaloarchaea archaeon]